MNLLHDKLTEHERQILKGLCCGQSFAEIAEVMTGHSAEALGVAAWRMYPKIGAKNAIEAAYKWGCGEVKDASLVDIKLIGRMIAEAAARQIK